MGIGKPKLCTKFEVDSFSHCENIAGNSNFEPRATPTLSSACDFIMGFGKPQLRAKFEVSSPRCCRNIMGNPKFLGTP